MIEVRTVTFDFWKTMMVVSGIKPGSPFLSSTFLPYLISKFVWFSKIVNDVYEIARTPKETQGFLNAGPADSFPTEGTLITEITFGANIDPEERFPGYGLYKVVHNTGEENYFLNTMLILSFRCPVLRGVKSTAGTFNIT